MSDFVAHPRLYLCRASDRLLNNLPGFAYVVPAQWPRLPQDTKRVCDVRVLARDIHMAGTLRRRLRDRGPVDRHCGDSFELRTHCGRVGEYHDAARPVGRGIPASVPAGNLDQLPGQLR